MSCQSMSWLRISRLRRRRLRVGADGRRKQRHFGAPCVGRRHIGQAVQSGLLGIGHHQRLQEVRTRGQEASDMQICM